LAVNGKHVLRERGNIPIDEIRKQEGEILYWGGFSAGGKLYTDFENRLKLYDGALLSLSLSLSLTPWGKYSIPGPFFRGESLCYHNGTSVYTVLSEGPVPTSHSRMSQIPWKI
jgi:hypothetical protein